MPSSFEKDSISHSNPFGQKDEASNFIKERGTSVFQDGKSDIAMPSAIATTILFHKPDQVDQEVQTSIVNNKDKDC